MIRTLLKPFSFLPALCLMYMIYSFSAQTGDISSQLSYKVSYKIVYTVDDVLDAQMADWEIETWVYRIHGLVRKLAHMAEYFALAVAVSFPLYVYGVHGIWLMLLAGIICVGFACGDEYHQSFVEGRSPSTRDVCIDGFGVFWGIILVRIIGWTGRKTIFRPRKKKEKVKNHHWKKGRQQEPDFAQEEMFSEPYSYHYDEAPIGGPYPNGSYMQQNGYPNERYPQQGMYQNEPYPQYFYQPEQERESEVIPTAQKKKSLHNNFQSSTPKKPQKRMSSQPDEDDPFQDWKDDYFPVNSGKS